LLISELASVIDVVAESEPSNLVSDLMHVVPSEAMALALVVQSSVVSLGFFAAIDDLEKPELGAVRINRESKTELDEGQTRELSIALLVQLLFVVTRVDQLEMTQI